MGICEQDLPALVEFAQALATTAAQEILPRFRTDVPIANKRPGDFDPVTDADRAAEALIRDQIGQHYPNHGIVGEEHADTQLDAEYLWIIDPIDGTRGFIAGLLQWGTLVGLCYQGMPEIGVMHQPYVGETFFASPAGAFHRDSTGTNPLQVRQCGELKDALLCATTPAMFAPEFEQRTFQEVSARVQDIRYGTDCYGYCALAQGQVDLVIEAGLGIYDIMPLVPIISNAGGIVTDWTGGPPKAGRIVAAGDARVHAEALTLLNSG